jgi:hypothetical protein
LSGGWEVQGVGDVGICGHSLYFDKNHAPWDACSLAGRFPWPELAARLEYFGVTAQGDLHGAAVKHDDAGLGGRFHEAFSLKQ